MVLIPEIPGIHPGVLALGNHLVDNGFTVAIPSLFGEPGKPKTVGYTVAIIARACVAREFAAFALNKQRPVSLFLRALARDLNASTPGKGVGVLLLLAFPGWYLISLGQAWLVIVVIAVAIGFGVNTMLGPQCALLPEMFGNKHRYLGVAVSREFSAVIAGGLAGVLGAALIKWFDGSWVPLGVYTFVAGGHHLGDDLHHAGDPWS